MIVDFCIYIIAIVQRFISLLEFIFCTRRRYPGSMCPCEFAFCAGALIDGDRMFPIESVNNLFGATIFFGSPRQLTTSQRLIALLLKSQSAVCIGAPLAYLSNLGPSLGPKDLHGRFDAIARYLGPEREAIRCKKYAKRCDQ